MDDVMHKIANAAKEISKSGKSPTVVFLTYDEEWELVKLKVKEHGSLAEEFVSLGPRRAIAARGGELMGLGVVWDAREFKVE